MIGIDTVQISRIEKMFERFGDKAFKKFLHEDELKLAKNNTSVAGFYAAKEAVSKALGIGISENCSFFDIKIQKDKKGAPFFTLSKKLIDSYEITDTALSISHDGEYAIAVAAIETKHSKEKPISH